MLTDQTTSTPAGPNPREARLQRLAALKPKEFRAGESLVHITAFGPEPYPLLIGPACPDTDLYTWVSNHAGQVETLLQKHGALLFRGFPVHSVEAFEAFLAALGGKPLQYVHRSSPRHEVQNNIYTSTDHPHDQVINLHNEHSYSHEWPLKIVFHCLVAPADAGETPIADSRKVFAALREPTRRQFIDKGVKYVRHMGTGLGMRWQDVFQTTDKGRAEAFCRQYGMTYQWLDQDRLRLEFTRPAVRRHPRTHEPVWFNHAFFFNLRSYDETLREAVLAQGKAEDFPFLTYYGDGSEIPGEVIEEIRQAYEGLKVSFAWQKGDVLVLDNMLMAHGRNAYQGDRKILVGMLEPYQGQASVTDPTTIHS
ncbi:MAG: TauD/TfdA family dioxygenase [Cytophagales bacterium]|nr:TauD/TfdA family dioxygenase [Cytophagales bacterium]